MKFFTADYHIDHEGVLEMSGRLFRNILEHNQAMVTGTNSVVGQDDTLFVLGDVGWNGIENFLNQLNCKNVHLIWGNHDKNSYGKLFRSSQDVLETKIGPEKQKVWLSHYPHFVWPASHHGSFHLYGHCHRQREATLDAAFPGRRSMDVGVDNALKLLGSYRPFNEMEIIRILGERPGHDPISFYEDFQAKLPKYRGATVGVDHGAVPPTVAVLAEFRVGGCSPSAVYPHHYPKGSTDEEIAFKAKVKQLVTYCKVAKLSKDGSAMCALLGPDLQVGEAEFVPLPPLADREDEFNYGYIAYEKLLKRLGVTKHQVSYKWLDR